MGVMGKFFSNELGALIFFWIGMCHSSSDGEFQNVPGSKFDSNIKHWTHIYQSGIRNTDGLLAHRRASSPQTGYYPAHRRATSFEIEK